MLRRFSKSHTCDRSIVRDLARSRPKLFNRMASALGVQGVGAALRGRSHQQCQDAGVTAQMENLMTKVKVAGFSVSLDGFAAGTAQTLDHPLGLRGEELFQWFFPTRTFRQMLGKEDGETGLDDRFAQRAMEGFGAFILGRNMFGPVRGEWPDDQWKGWWGDNPPYHAPTFVLTHFPRPPIEMLGGTTFHFVSDGIEDALQKAREAAGAKDVKIGGGVQTVRQYVQAGYVDEIHLAFAPIALGEGESLFSGLDLRALGYRTVEHVPTDRATHIVLAK